MRINLWGGPGVGKSTLAANIFSVLKSKKYSIELVQEYIKSWVYLNRYPKSFDQGYVFAKQMHAEDIVLQNVEHLISDSPVGLQIVYCKLNDLSIWPELLGISKKFNEKYPSINFYLERSETSYQTCGRYHNYDQACKIDLQIKNFMDEYLHKDYFVVKYDSNLIVDIVEQAIQESKYV